MDGSGIFKLLCTALAAVAAVGCATTLPTSYENRTGLVAEVRGDVLALAGEGSTVVAATSKGLFMKRGVGRWEPVEAPGLRNFGKVTCLSMVGDDIYVGTDGEGLHILADGVWEVRTARYGGLADDRVLSLARDTDDNGLPGEAVWVGTARGISALRGGKWSVYEPDGNWLSEISGSAPTEPGDVYIGSGFRLGTRGEEGQLFQPPVTAIGIGPDSVVFGSSDSRLTMVREGVFSVYRFKDRAAGITSLLVDGPVIWVGTETGLVWGGLSGKVEGNPWPGTTPGPTWSAVLFGARDTRHFRYRWRPVGYNTARIKGLDDDPGGLWVAFSSKGRDVRAPGRLHTAGADEVPSVPVTDIRRYVNINEYVERKEKPYYERYRSSAGIKGEPSALIVTGEGNEVWIGTGKGLYGLER